MPNHLNLINDFPCPSILRDGAFGFVQFSCPEIESQLYPMQTDQALKNQTRSSLFYCYCLLHTIFFWLTNIGAICQDWWRLDEWRILTEPTFIFFCCSIKPSFIWKWKYCNMSAWRSCVPPEAGLISLGLVDCSTRQADLTLSLLSSKSTFSRPFKEKMHKWGSENLYYNHLSSE